MLPDLFDPMRNHRLAHFKRPTQIPPRRVVEREDRLVSTRFAFLLSLLHDLLVLVTRDIWKTNTTLA